MIKLKKNFNLVKNSLSFDHQNILMTSYFSTKKVLENRNCLNTIPIFFQNYDVNLNLIDLFHK